MFAGSLVAIVTPMRAEGANVAPDQIGPFRAQRFRRQIELLKDARTKILDHGVSLFDDQRTQGAHVVGAAKIDRDTVLAAVEAKEGRCDIAPEWRTPAAGGVAARASRRLSMVSICCALPRMSPMVRRLWTLAASANSRVPCWTLRVV